MPNGVYLADDLVNNAVEEGEAAMMAIGAISQTRLIRARVIRRPINEPGGYHLDSASGRAEEQVIARCNLEKLLLREADVPGGRF